MGSPFDVQWSSMAEIKPQTLQNHVRFDPLFHGFVLPVFLINVIVTIVHFVRDMSFNSGWMIVVAIALLVGAVKTRNYPLKAQDRVIRLEERMRMNSVLPEPLRTRAGILTESQIIALRFAPDDELPALVEKTLAGAFPKQADIKKAVAIWRPDHFRV
jgi:Family of unknown function (DUF6526)